MKKKKVLTKIALAILCSLICIVTAGEGLSMTIITKSDIPIWSITGNPWYYPLTENNMEDIKAIGLMLLIIAFIFFAILIRMMVKYFGVKEK